VSRDDSEKLYEGSSIDSSIETSGTNTVSSIFSPDDSFGDLFGRKSGLKTYWSA